MNHYPGLVAAAHAPFHDDGRVNLAAVEKQAEHFVRSGTIAAFVNGSTGESHSLAVGERIDLAQRWIDAARGSSLAVVVHVGANCLADARSLAEHAQRAGAAAVSAIAPTYFKPDSVAALVACCREIAAAAPGLPFYYYDIPSMTGLRLGVPEFLAAAADAIPNLAGAKFSNPDLADFQRCLHALDGRMEILWGIDEYLLAALALGGRGAVGSSYNYAAPLYVDLLAAFARGDLAAARGLQFRAARTIAVLARYGYLAASKAVMEALGVPVGPPRLPLSRLSEPSKRDLLAELESQGLMPGRR